MQINKTNFDAKVEAPSSWPRGLMWYAQNESIRGSLSTKLKKLWNWAVALNSFCKIIMTNLFTKNRKEIHLQVRPRSGYVKNGVLVVSPWMVTKILPYLVLT